MTFQRFLRSFKSHSHREKSVRKLREVRPRVDLLEDRFAPAVIDLATVSHWVGSGSNQAAMVVDWHNGQANDSVVFGYRWDGVATGEDMLKAVAANGGLYATIYHYSFGDAIFGLGLDRNDGQFSVTPSTPAAFVSGVTKLPDSSDGNPARAAVDGADFYTEDFLNGYWSYWTAAATDNAWNSSWVGMGDRVLANGDVDGWSYAAGFADIAPSTPVNPNSRPSITTGVAFSIPEGSTSVATIQASDPDVGQTVTYSIAGGADAAKFAINGSTGALSFLAAPNFSTPQDAGQDNVYDVVVKAADNASPSAFDTKAIQVTVTDVPVNFGQVTKWIGTGSNQAAMVVDWHNGQANDSVVFGYRWDGVATGEDMLKAVAANAGLYATIYHYSFGDAIFGLGLDRNDGQFSVTPSTPAAFVSGVTMLPDSSDGNPARAAVDGADFYNEDFLNGYWSYWTTTSTASAWSSSWVGMSDRVLANGDVDGWSYAAGFADVAPSTPVNPNTRPSITTGATFSVLEGSTSVATIQASDPDAGQSLTYSIAGGADASKFTINGSTGALSFVAAPSVSNPQDAGHDNVYDVVVKAADNASPSAFDTKAIQVTVVQPVVPTVTSVAPFVGPTSGGATVVIVGTGFNAITSVKFGGVDATSFTVVSPTQITAVMPSGASSTLKVVVTNSAGTSSTADSGSDFTYATPAVTSVVVNGGDIAARNRLGGTPALAGQNSVIEQILVSFNQRVKLDANAFTLVSLAGSIDSVGIAPATADVAVNATGVTSTGDATAGFSQYVLTFAAGDSVNSFDGSASGGLGNVYTTLKSGVFQLNTIGSRIHAGVSDTAANRSDQIWSLYGAANSGDVKTTDTPGGSTLLVDGLALNEVYATFGSTAGATTPAYSSAYDWNFDGHVDGVDLNQLYRNFGTIWRF